MAHISVEKIGAPISIVEAREVNPLISKCQIKVCYVGQDPNRNGSIISKAVAEHMGATLPGSPIIGYFSEEKQDFRDHSDEIRVNEDGEISFKQRTRPYGFVDIHAPVWFQTFTDDGVDHEYLMTEGYLWTGRYPEVNSVLETGKGQSMELDEERTHGFWSEPSEDGESYFIINEACISALCLLGDDVEPCFEGASVYSLNTDLKSQIFELTKKMKDILKEGDFSMEEKVVDNVKLETSETEVKTDAPAVEYNLEEIPEYVELSEKYSALETQVASLQAEIETLNHSLEEKNGENESLVAFKKEVERKEKQAMIDSFYMLSEEDKKDVIENIDTYSIDDIEAKLSIACVRNKVSFATPEQEQPAPTATFSLSGEEDEVVPAWIQAINTVAKDMK